MVTIDQVQKGVLRFVNEQVIVSFDGWQRIVVSGFAGLMTANLHKLVKMYSDNPFVVAIGLYDPESGRIDIESLYNSFVPQMNGEKIPITIPKIGTIKLGKQEIECLCRYIMEV